MPTSQTEPWGRAIFASLAALLGAGGRRALVDDISEREVVVALLAHLKLPTEAPPIARARSPGFDSA